MIDQYPSPSGVLTSLIWRKTMSGGETSLSGYDNANQALSYTPGQEQVYLNGILLVRGDDYTATNGTSITGLSALSSGDFVQVNCYNNFSVASMPATSITGTIANNQLANSAITINGSSVSLGGSVTLAGDIESVTASSPLTGGGTTGAVTVGIQDASTSQKGAVQLSDSTSTTSSILAATPTAVKSAYDLAAAAIPKNLTTTTGDIIYASGANTPARLGIGSTGQVLTVSGGVPSWATASGGAIKQIVYAKTSSNTSASGAATSTVVDVTGLTASITPTSASSKIWVSMWMQSYHSRTGSDRAQGFWKLIRGSTQIANAEHMVIAGNDIETYTSFIASLDYVDSPNTTSSTTYKIQYNGTGAGDESFTCYSGAHILLMEI